MAASEQNGTDAAASLLGWWRLLSSTLEFRDAQPIAPESDGMVQGYLVFSTEGRMMALVAARAPHAPTSDAECARAYRCMAAYSGTYRVAGDRWITRVDAAWHEGWIGSEQERIFRLESGVLHVSSPWYHSPLHENRCVRAHLAWVRDAAPAVAH
jgi:hypothetical protein